MTRERKYRGRRIDDGEWVYGYYYQGEVVEISGAWILFEGDDLEWHRVDPKTVGDWTGLKDSKGVEIFEGDVVKCWKKRGFIPDGEIEMVEAWAIAEIRSNGWSFYFKEISSNDPHGWFFHDPESVAFTGCSELNETITILGNVFEHPHLIEGE